MAASIILSELSWAASGRPPLFSSLNLTFGPVRTGLVGRNGTGKSTLVRLIAGDLRPLAGTVSVNGRLGVQRQAVQVSPDQTIAELFGIGLSLAILRCAEQGLATAEELSDADWTLETRLASALNRVGLTVAPETPLASLSGGQRTRAGLAALLFAEPDFLILDEPTNNLDRAGRVAVIDLLASWRSGAIVVSHDRELLDTMDAIVELTTVGATRYGGNWSEYREQKSLELLAIQRSLADAEKRISDVARSVQATAERHSRKTNTAQKKRAKGALPRILLGGRKERGETTRGENVRRAERRREDALAVAEADRQRIEVLQPFSVELPPTKLPAGKVVLSLDNVTAGYELDHPILRQLSLSIAGPERVAVTGPNGSGKTTLLAVVNGQLRPWTGTAQVRVSCALLDQRVSVLDETASIRENFMRLNPGSTENACRASLARFMFPSDAALQVVGTLSGGQLLRAGLACVLGGPTPPPLLILDEPTNHLDLDAIEAVEAGLRAYDGALLIVSHDEAFLTAIGIDRRLEFSSAVHPIKPE